MLSSSIYTLKGGDTNKLLNQLDEWRSGICPDGTLAKQPCFVLNQKPTVYIHPDQLTSPYLTTDIITEWEWADRLIECGAVNHLNDDLLMRTMSDFFSIFHAFQDRRNNKNTLHLIQMRKHASFKVDNIERPTKALQTKLEQVLSEPDDTVQWMQLVDLWETFGYLWPRKIVMGYKIHHKQQYSFSDPHHSTNEFHKNYSLLKERFGSTPKMPEFDLDRFLETASIVSRLELAPLHEFLDIKSRQSIERIIHARFIQVPLYHPIKLYNVSTRSYLCWGPGAHAQPDPIFPGEKLDYLVRSIVADPEELNRSPETQYLWRITWLPTAVHQPFDNAVDLTEINSHSIRGSGQVYIYPACRSASALKTRHMSLMHKSNSWQINDRMGQDSDSVDTHKMALTCLPYRYELRSAEPLNVNGYDRQFSKLRGLRLLSSSSSHYEHEKIDWTIQYPNNGLKYMTNAQADIKLNFHEHIRRIKPVMVGDMIQLQQVGLLTSFDQSGKTLSDGQPPLKYESSPDQLVQPQSLRTTKRIATRKPSTKSKNKKNVLCVDEDITFERFSENTYWRIQLPTPFDQKRHSSNFVRWPAKNDDKKYGYPTDYHPMLSQDVRNHLSSYLNKDTGSLASIATTASSLRRTRSLGSLHEKPSIMHATTNSDKAKYYEDLVANKGTSKLLSQFVKKVSLQPLAQLVKPLRPKNVQSSRLEPPPFSSHHSFN